MNKEKQIFYWTTSEDEIEEDQPEKEKEKEKKKKKKQGEKAGFYNSIFYPLKYIISPFLVNNTFHKVSFFKFYFLPGVGDGLLDFIIYSFIEQGETELECLLSFIIRR